MEGTISATADAKAGATLDRTEDKKAERALPTFPGRRCFVIMPYGKKNIIRDDPGTAIDFDMIFEQILTPAIEALGLECIRSDRVSRSGLIQKQMIEDIIECDAVVVDITLHNPNVFYELGIRHTARRSGTVIIRLDNHPIPFNINGMRVLNYRIEDDEQKQAARESIGVNIANSLGDQSIDSLVYTLTDESMSIQRIGRPIEWMEVHRYRHGDLPGRTLGFITGDVCHVKSVDVWLNPENTRMQMGRMHDESLSACVRYLGGRKDIHKTVVKDLIADELELKIRLGRPVEAGHVVVTGPGELSRTHNVKAIFHAAAMNGEPTKGYQLIRNYPSCVTMALTEMDRLNGRLFDGMKLNPLRGKLKSILFPLFGSRDRARDPQAVANRLVLAATNYLEDHPDSTIRSVYFLAYTDVDRDLCETAFRRNSWVLDKSTDTKAAP